MPRDSFLDEVGKKPRGLSGANLSINTLHFAVICTTVRQSHSVLKHSAASTLMRRNLGQRDRIKHSNRENKKLSL